MMRSRQFAFVILLIVLATPAFAHRWELGYDPSEHIPQISSEKSGVIPTRKGLCLRLNADPGNVHIFTDDSEQVSYRVVVEADSRDPGAEDFLQQFAFGARRFPGGVSIVAHSPWREFRGRFTVSFEVRVPRRYDLKINTQGGNIDVQDIDGQVDLVTAGGDITVSRVGKLGNARRVAAHLETQGGHITMGDVAGAVQAETAGGHILAGNINGDALLRTGGGHIQTGHITGIATLETGGGNLRVEKGGASVTADTAGGQINFDEAAGALHVQTGDGAVHIDHVTGPTLLEGSSSGIFLRQVDAPLRASAGSGNMILYVPRGLAATIDAAVARSGGHRIVADPSLPLTIDSRDSESGSHTMRFQGKLNGGGEILHLLAASGNIILRPGEPRGGWSTVTNAAWMPADPGSSAMRAWSAGDDAAGFFEEFRRSILESWWGGVPVDPGEMQKHLEHSVAPAYPDVARQAGVEGDVALRVYVSSDGRVTNLKVLDGPPILARAAVAAVRQWEYQALKINGRPANVVTTLIVAFRLH